MKNYLSNLKVLATSVILASLAVSGCSIYKPTAELNIYHPNVYGVYGNITTQVRGVLCTKPEFVNNFGSGKTQQPRLSIVLNKGYSRYITGNILDYNKKNVQSSLGTKELVTNSAFQQECGANKKYPIIHEFSFDLEEGYPDRKGKDERMAE